MAIELKQSLKLSQQLVITPQLQQAIKLLQLSRVELVDMVQNELMENPILEEAPQAEDEEVPKEVAAEIEAKEPEDKSHEAAPEVGNKDGELTEPKDFDWENYMETYNSPGEEMRSSSRVSNEDLPSFENMVSARETLSEHLEWQLRMEPHLTEQEEEIGYRMIGALDDNGYLTTSLEEFAQKNGCSFDDADEMLALIQDFDPPGVGARDLKECLCLQARPFGKERPFLEKIIKEHLDLLQRKDYGALAKKLKLPLKSVIHLCHIIQEMEPKPGRAHMGGDIQYITPDVYVHKLGDDYAIVLNDEGLPRLRISHFYQQMVRKQEHGHSNGESKVAKDYVQDKLKSALWLIKSIHQRQRTLYRVSKCIVNFQKEFFDTGIDYLKPMILKDVAEEIGMHESTVSRATSNKYMHTPQGIFELKYFFNSGIARTTGQDLAAETVKAKIRRIVANENARHPLSDKEIVDLLSQANIDIARRTVAKYREVLGILPSSKRRQLYPDN